MGLNLNHPQPTDRPGWDEYWLRIAVDVATRRTCAQRETGVGCVLVNAHHAVLATGYNGPPSGRPNCTEHPCPGADSGPGQGAYTCEAVHAEINALMQCQDVHAIHTVYTTVSPCFRCIGPLMNTGASRIVFLQEHHHPQSKDLWLYPHPLKQREWVHHVLGEPS